MSTTARDLDPHRHAVYQWEADWWSWNHETATKKACRAAVKAACRRSKIVIPSFRWHGGKVYSWNIPKLRIISMQSDNGCNIATALHEVAHQIAWDYFGSSIQDHGPTWLGIYMDLLTVNQLAPRAALEATARQHGLTWNETNIRSRRKIQRATDSGNRRRTNSRRLDS